MNRPLLVAALVVAIALTGQAGAALADDPGATPVAQPSVTSSDSPAPAATSGDVTPSESPSPAANQAPVTSPDAASVQAGRSVTVDVVANDTDPDNGPAALQVTGVDDARATFSGRTVTFTAPRADSGSAAVGYRVSDGADERSGTLTVTITQPARSVTLDVPDRLVALRRYTLRGRAFPTSLGRPTVIVQRRSGDAWVAWGKDRADDTGGYAVPFRTNRPVTFVLRAKAVWADGKVRYSDTRKRAITVLADPVVSGPLTRSQVPWSWRAGCPVPPSGLRTVTINRIDYHHLVARGTLVVRASVAQQMVSVFTAAINDRFPVKSMHPTDYYYDGGRRTPTESDVAAMRAGNTAAFNCRPVTGNPYRISQHSYGNAIDINTVQNPYVTGSRVYPSFAREYLDRSPYRQGMILRGGVIAARMAQLGWPWGARWSHPDYQHFSSNGG